MSAPRAEPAALDSDLPGCRRSLWRRPRRPADGGAAQASAGRRLRRDRRGAHGGGWASQPVPDARPVADGPARGGAEAAAARRGAWRWRRPTSCRAGRRRWSPSTCRASRSASPGASGRGACGWCITWRRRSGRGGLGGWRRSGSGWTGCSRCCPSSRPSSRRLACPVRFVGHPVVESGVDGGDAARFRAAHGIGPEERPVIVMPGSRRGEIGRLIGSLRRGAAARGTGGAGAAAGDAGRRAGGACGARGGGRLAGAAGAPVRARSRAGTPTRRPEPGSSSPAPPAWRWRWPACRMWWATG